MTRFPDIPRVENAPEEMFSRGHLEITEKLDGASCRIQVSEDSIRLGNRNTIFSGKLDAPSVFEHVYNHIDDVLDFDAVRRYRDANGPFTIHGEALHKHTIEYNWGEMPSFIGFAIQHHDDELVPSAEARETISSFGLSPITPIEVIPAEEFAVEDFAGVQSQWYDGVAEGIIIRNTETGDWAQHVVDEFSEIDTSMEISEEATMEELLQAFEVRRRSMKVIQDFQDEGFELHTISGHEIVEEVFNDILREEYSSIVQKKGVASLSDFKSAVQDEVQVAVRESRREGDY